VSRTVLWVRIGLDESVGRELGMEKRSILANMTLTIVMKKVPICATGGIVMAPQESVVLFGCSATTKDDYT
jgi:hypothetical protein